MLPERWKKCVDSRGEYVEDWHVQVSVWQLWFKKKISPGHICTTLYLVFSRILLCRLPSLYNIYPIKKNHVNWETLSSFPEML
jgi:hypothetical protein